MSKARTPNSVEGLTAQSTLTGTQEYLTSTSGKLNTTASVSISGSSLPVAGATTAIVTAIVDSSGNQISTFGGGTQYQELATTAPGTGTLSLGRYKSSAPTLTDGQLYGLQLDASGNLKINVVAGGASGGTSSSFSAAFPSTGTAAGATDGTNMQPLKVDGSNNLLTKINAALPAGTNVIGHAIIDTGSTTAVTQATAANLNATVVGTGTFAAQVTGTVTANAGTNLNTSLLALESGGNLATIAGAVISQEATTSGVKGVTVFGAVTTNAPTYTTAKSDALSLDTGGLLRVSLKDTPSNTNNLNVNLAASAATVTITGTVTTSPPSNASTNIAQINGVTPLMGNGVTGTGSQRVTIASDNTAFSVNATLSAETTKVIGVVRNADGSGNLLTSTANALDINIKSGSIANTSFAATQATASSLNATVTQGPAAALTAGWTVINGEQNDTTGTFTNATQTTSVTATNLAGYGNVLISINGTYGTATAIFEGSDDGGTTWYTIGEAARTDSNVVEGGYTSLTNTTRAWQTNNPGWDSLRVRSTAVASGTVNVRISPSAAPSAAGATVQLGSAIPTGSNVIGSVNQGTSPWITDGAAESPTGTSVPASASYLGLLAQTANPSAATPGNLVGALADKLGKQVVVGSIRDLKVQQQTTITASTGETTVLTQVASTFLDVYGVIIANTSASACDVTFKDSTGGTTRFDFQVPAGDTRGFMLPESGAIPQATVNNNWTATCGTSVTSIKITMLAVKNI